MLGLAWSTVKHAARVAHRHYSRFLHCQSATRPARTLGMPTVAEQLRAAREAKNLSITEVAEITKIRTDHIRALEEGNFDVFVAPVYIRGFTRTYATLLKLDVPQVIRALEVELGKTEKFSEPPPLTESDRSVVNFMTLQLSKLNLHRNKILIALAVIAVISISLSIWKRQRKADPTTKAPPARVVQPNRNSGNTLPLPAPAPAPRR